MHRQPCKSRSRRHASQKMGWCYCSVQAAQARAALDSMEAAEGSPMKSLSTHLDTALRNSLDWSTVWRATASIGHAINGTMHRYCCWIVQKRCGQPPRSRWWLPQLHRDVLLLGQSTPGLCSLCLWCCVPGWRTSCPSRWRSPFEGSLKGLPQERLFMTQTSATACSSSSQPVKRTPGTLSCAA